MNHWDIRYINLARHISEWSKDPSTKVGAVITKNNRVLSLGFNGIPTGLLDEKYLETREIKIMTTMHAESNAIDFARGDLEGSTIYVTHHPCPACAGRIIQNGIKRVVTHLPEEEFRIRWNVYHTIRMLNDAGVAIDYMDIEQQ